MSAIVRNRCPGSSGTRRDAAAILAGRTEEYCDFERGARCRGGSCELLSSAAYAAVAVKALLEAGYPGDARRLEAVLLGRPFVLQGAAWPATLRKNAMAVSLNRRGTAVALVFGRALS